MMLTTWLIATLAFALPADYSLVGQASERMAQQGPPGRFANEEFRSWEAPGGKFLALFYWAPMAPRDGGPMVAAHETPAVVAGQQTKIIETSMFMGQTQRVLVTYLRFTEPEATAMIYAKGTSIEEFRALLAQLSVSRTPGK